VVFTNASSSGAGAGGATTTTTHASTGTSSTSSGSTSTGTGAQGVGGGLTIDAGPPPDGGTMPQAVVYGHSPDTLYKMDPVTKAVTQIGPFQGCAGQVIDLALDKDANAYVTTWQPAGVYKLDTTTAACTLIRQDNTNGLAYPNSLSFVPAGTVLPNEEALVGYDFQNNYIRIDTTTGAITIIGAGVLSPYISSGDIVSVIGGGTYLTVEQGPENCNDCIVEVNPTTGAIVQMIGALQHSQVWGIAFWGGSAYGFDASGELFQIDLKTAATTLIPTPNAPPGITWWGAGSSTSAPLIPPK
jgi:hypothetical protein